MSHLTYQKNIRDNNSGCSIVNSTVLKAMRAIFLASVLCLILGATSTFSQTLAGSECVRATPTVIIGPTHQSGFPGNQLAFTITVTNHDRAGCNSSSFLVMPTFPESGFRHTPDCIRFSLSPGESGTRDVIIKSPGAACVGPKTFSEIAINENAPDFSGSAEAVFNVKPIIPDCGRANPTITISPVRRVGLAGAILRYIVTVENNDDPACGPSVFNITPGSSLFTITPNLSKAALTQLDTTNFNLLVPAGGRAFRVVRVRSDLFASGDLTLMQNAINVNAPCFRGSVGGMFSVTENADTCQDDCSFNAKIDFEVCLSDINANNPACTLDARRQKLSDCLNSCPVFGTNK